MKGIGVMGKLTIDEIRKRADALRTQVDNVAEKHGELARVVVKPSKPVEELDFDDLVD